MNHSDFKIGETFWTATGEWMCSDIGTHTIIAYKIPATNEPWDCQDNVVFYEYDFGGCEKEKWI